MHEADQPDVISDFPDPDGLTGDEALICRLAQVMMADRSLGDADYADGLSALGSQRLAELTYLVGYYSALALSLAVFRPVLPAGFERFR